MLVPFRLIKPETDAIMLRLDILLCGALVASVTTALALFMLQPEGNDDDAGRRQERAHEAKLAPTRHQLPSASAQFSSSARLQPVQQHSVDASAFAQGAVRSSIESSSAPTAVPPLSLLAPERQQEWNALVTGTLQEEVQKRLGRRLSQEQERRLVDTLARLRDVSLTLNQDPPDEADPSFLSEQLMGTLALLEADRTFRKELGIGVSEFIRGLDRGQIEEITTAPAKSKK
jgi:hypothetical protein